jgi:glutamyl-tRNA synthetase
MNGVYIRGLNLDDFARRALPFLEEGLPQSVPRPLDTIYVREVMPLVQERTKKLTEVPELTKFFFTEVLVYDPALLIAKNMTKEATLAVLDESLNRIGQLADFNDAGLETVLRPLAEELGIKAGQLFSILRTAVTGEVATPPLFQTMRVLGKERCLKRIREAIGKLGT